MDLDFTGVIFDGGNFDGVVTRRERAHRDKTLDGELFTALMKLVGCFGIAPNLSQVLSDAIGYGDFGLMGAFVESQIVKLEVNAEFGGAGELSTETWAHSVGVEDKLSRANLVGGQALDLIGKNQSAGIEVLFVKVGHAKNGFYNTDTSALRILNDDVQAVEPSAKGNRLLINGVEVQRRREK